MSITFIHATSARRLAAAAATIAALGTAGGLAVTAAPAGASSVSSQDVVWMQSNAQTDLAEITIGGIALDRARFATTRDLADKTRSDHEVAIAKLRSVAAEEGVTLPTVPNALQQDQAAVLREVTSSGFDATYDRDQIAGHETSIAQTRTEIADASSSVVRDYAESYLPVAEMHLSMTQSAYAQLTGASTSVATSTGAPTVEAGTGGMAAVRTGSAAPWIALTVAGGVLVVGAGGLAGRRRLVGRTRR